MALEPTAAASAADEDIITTGELDDAAARLAEKAAGKRPADDDAAMDEDGDEERPKFKKLKAGEDWVGTTDSQRSVTKLTRRSPAGPTSGGCRSRRTA